MGEFQKSNCLCASITVVPNDLDVSVWCDLLSKENIDGFDTWLAIRQILYLLAPEPTYIV